MPNRNLKLPEPSLAEHELIRASAPELKLSASFKAKVMAECNTSILAAQRAFRLKVIGGITVACCLTALICLSIPQTFDDQADVAEQPPASSSPQQQPLHVSPAMSSGSPGFAVDTARPAKGAKSDGEQLNDVIETLNDRKKMFNANMLPQF